MQGTSNISTMRTFEGVLVEVSGGGVVIDLSGRLGQLKIPLRMLISDEPPEVGQRVRFVMSYPEIIRNNNSNEGDEHK